MTRALYYPTIDITNEEWLKTAILFWDEINTIVPESITNPYHEISTQYLSDEGILQPLRINPQMDIIEDLTNDTLNYLNTNEEFQLLTNKIKYYIHREKLPHCIGGLSFYKRGLQHEIEDTICHTFKNNEWLQLDSDFAMFYMTLLANKLSETNSIALLTDNSLCSNLADKARLNNQILISDDYKHHYYRAKENSIKLVHDLLTNLIIETIKISPTSSLEQIIDFKRRHRDELGLFRTNLSKLTQNISKDKSIEAIRQEVHDIYHDEFEPAYNNFKKALSSSGIKWFAENFMKVSCFSAGATFLPTTLLGLSAPAAIIAAAGVSLTTSLVSYNADKQKIIRENPYSYLLAINNEIGK